MDKYIILKGRLRSDSMNFYSVFIIIIDRDLKVLDKIDVVATRIPTLYNSCAAEPWDAVQKQIIQYVFDGKNVDNLSKTISQTIDKIFLNEDVEYLINLIENEIEKFKTIVEENINRAFNKASNKLEFFKTYVQSLDDRKVENEDISENIANLENAVVSFDVPPEVTVIPVKPVLAPVSGTPIYELVINDKIYVNIDTSFEKAREYISYFNLKQDDRILPVKGEILEILIDINNNYVVLVKLDDTTYGQIIEEEKVKVRKIEEKDLMESVVSKNRNYTADNTNNNVKKKKNSSVPLILFGVAVALIIILILLLFT